MRLSDTQIEIIEDDIANILQTKTPSERLYIANNMWRSASLLITAFLHSQHPDWDDAAIKAEVLKRLAHGTH